MNKVMVALMILTVMIFSASTQSLDPEQTVNPATGEMSFSLPLGTVQGINGHNFPINLYYKAGIRLNEEASPAGLGFSYDVGTIARKEVFVSDDSKGGINLYCRQEIPNHCDPSTWIKIFNFICSVIAVILVVIALICNPAAGSALGVALLSGGITIGAAQIIANKIAFSGMDFLGGGGPGTPSYSGGPNDGRGFFKGGKLDLPDAYFISCPFLSGEMVWAGTDSTGHFVLKTINGSALKGKETIKINRNIDTEGYTIFEII